MADILPFRGNTIIPDDPVDVMEKAKAWGLSRVVICGTTPEGEFIFGGSHSEIGETLLLLEIARRRLLAEADAD